MSFPKSIRTGDCKTGAHVCFTDESRFHLSTSNRRVLVWRRPGERYEDCNITETDIYGKNFLTKAERLVLTALRFRDEILDSIVKPFAGAVGDNFILMQDNARSRTARVCIDYINRETIEVIDLKHRTCAGHSLQTYSPA